MEDWKGDRITVAAFEPRHMERLSEEHKGVLEFLGFRPLLQEVRLAPMREIQTFMDEEEYPRSDDVELGSLNFELKAEDGTHIVKWWTNYVYGRQTTTTTTSTGAEGHDQSFEQGLGD